MSGGLEAVVKATSIAKHFTGIWGCCFDEVGVRVARMRNAISFTEKTKYIDAINKEIENEVRRDHYAVNRAVAEENTRIPFSNMIYVGDGLRHARRLGVAPSGKRPPCDQHASTATWAAWAANHIDLWTAALRRQGLSRPLQAIG